MGRGGCHRPSERDPRSRHDLRASMMRGRRHGRANGTRGGPRALSTPRGARSSSCAGSGVSQRRSGRAARCVSAIRSRPCAEQESSDGGRPNAAPAKGRTQRRRRGATETATVDARTPRQPGAGSSAAGEAPASGGTRGPSAEGADQAPPIRGSDTLRARADGNALSDVRAVIPSVWRAALPRVGGVG